MSDLSLLSSATPRSTRPLPLIPVTGPQAVSRTSPPTFPLFVVPRLTSA
ncbi:hypothetical protein [Pseudomonas sp. NFACC02]|nr:hypothetical protein [Pseudomonas sp. NFACC02]